MSSLLAMRTDRELLADYVASGSEAAFAEIVARHGRMIYRTCLRSLGNAHDAEEAAQAAFLVLVQRRRALRSEGELGAWLHRVALNTAHLALRGRARRSRHEEAAAMARKTLQPDDAAPAGGAAVGNLDAELDRLPAAQRQAVVLRYLEGRSQEEAARAAGCPQGTLARRAQIGIERLRERLCQRGQVLSAAALIGLLGAEAGAAVPETLLPSILAASKLAAGGLPAAAIVAEAGAAGQGAMALAEGVLKMMFWAKMKLVAAVIGVVLAAGGAGGAVAGRMLAGEQGGPNAAPPAAEAGGEAVNGLKVVLSSRKAQCRHGEPWEFEAKAVNVGKEPLALDYYDRQLRLEIQGPAGAVEYNPRTVLVAEMRAAKEASYFATVAPGGEQDLSVSVVPGFKAGIPAAQVVPDSDRGDGWGGWPPIPVGEYRVKVVLENKSPDDTAKFGIKAKEWVGAATSNEIVIKVLAPDGAGGEKQPDAAKAVNGLKLSISADPLGPKAGDAVNVELALENVSKESMHILKFDYLAVSWELVAPDGQSLASAPTAMPGLMPPGAKDYPELKAGAKLSWRGKTIAGNPPEIYAGPAANYRNVYLLKPGTYKLTAVYILPEGQGKGVAPGKVWSGTVRSNTLEIKFGGEFKAPADASQWPPDGVPGITPPQNGGKAAVGGGAPDEATARRLAQEFLERETSERVHIGKISDERIRWYVRYGIGKPPVDGLIGPPVVLVDKKTGKVEHDTRPRL